MPMISTSPVRIGNDLVTKYEGGATTTLQTFTFPSMQETTTMFNDGVRPITLTFSDTSVDVQPNVAYQITDNISLFQVKTYQDSQPFRVEGRVDFREAMRNVVNYNVVNSYNLKNLFTNGFNTVDDFYFKYKNNTVASAWSFATGKATSGTNATDASISLVKGKKFIDGRIDIICDNPSTSASWFGIVLGYDDITNTFIIVMLRLGKLEIWTNQGTTFSRITSYDTLLTDQDTTITTDKPVSLGAEKIGNLIKCYVNDRMVRSFESTFVQDMKNGGFGVIADNTRSHTFSNISASYVDYTVIKNKISKVIFLGSSITNGFAQNTKYRDLAVTKLKDNVTGETVIGINGGVNGSTTTDMLTRLPALITANPDTSICVIEGSVNDVKATGTITSDISISNIRKMIKMCKQYGIIPIVTTPTPIIYGFGAVGNSPDWTSQSWIQLCNMAVKIRQLAIEENVRLVDNAKTFGKYTLAEKQTIIPDGVHPNDTGANDMAQTVLDTVSI